MFQKKKKKWAKLQSYFFPDGFFLRGGRERGGRREISKTQFFMELFKKQKKKGSPKKKGVNKNFF